MPVECVCIAAVDFDGTLLEGHAPVRMIPRLVQRGYIPWSTAVKAGWWGLRYKLHMSVEQAQVREHIFSAFTHLPVEEADKIMADFYHEDLQKRLRPKAKEVIFAHQEAGHKVVLVSASFMPILKEVAKDVKADWFICSQMEIENGHYTSSVAHTPPEGEQKLIQLTAWANSTFGINGPHEQRHWELGFAYGDHHSDIPLLQAAQKPVAVNPDSRLERTAKRAGWEIVDWSSKPH